MTVLNFGIIVNEVDMTSVAAAPNGDLQTRHYANGMKMFFIKIRFGSKSVNVTARNHYNFLSNTCKTMIMGIRF